MSDRSNASLGRTVLLAAGGIALTLVLITVPLFVVPPSATVEEVRAGGPVDAVLVLGGGPGDRIGAALALVAQLPEPPPTLAVSIAYGAPLVTCGTAPDLPRVPVVCFEPDPFTTAGEAAWLGAAVAEHGWERVVVVTSDFHISRSRRLAQACVEAAADDVEVVMVAADTNPLSLHGAFAIATEWPSYLGTGWDHRPSCRG